ncbi:MAG: nuclear transport factor 2 family protein [Actinobacteria bacterium]|nr:nuclear transport factor 2 family protein [Actinomycetota bacterium]
MAEKSENLVPGPGWASAHGYVPLNPASAEAGSSSAIDRLLILERLHRYSWALDECLQQPLAECFTEDATWTADLYGKEDYGPFEGAAGIAEWLAGSFVTMVDQRRHLFINPVVDELVEDAARVFSMCLITGAKDEIVTPRCTGIYRVGMRKIDGDWLIAELFGAFDAPW